jgi:hypothetical protein
MTDAVGRGDDTPSMELLDTAVIHLLKAGPPYNVKVGPRSNNAIAAGLSSFAGTTTWRTRCERLLTHNYLPGAIRYVN